MQKQQEKWEGPKASPAGWGDLWHISDSCGDWSERSELETIQILHAMSRNWTAMNTLRSWR